MLCFPPDHLQSVFANVLLLIYTEKCYTRITTQVMSLQVEAEDEEEQVRTG